MSDWEEIDPETYLFIVRRYGKWPETIEDALPIMRDLNRVLAEEHVAIIEKMRKEAS